MNISQPDKTSSTYQTFVRMVEEKVSQIANWLANKNIECIRNNWIGNHLYRIYIPSKELLLDFEYYPVNNIEYNYIRINWDTDVIRLMEKLYPEVTIDTTELKLWKLTQRATNRFLRENGISPIYDKNVLRIALVKDTVIYQCMVIKNSRILTNTVKHTCAIPYGTYIMLRYLTEMFGFSEILIKESTDNSYVNTLYQLLNLPIVCSTNKKKIWWNATTTKWKIKKELTSQFVPFYYCESVVYKYDLGIRPCIPPGV